MTKETTVGFSVSGEFITEHARNLIAEGRPGAAWHLLHVGMNGMNTEHIAAIMSGNKKLVGVNDCELVDDDPKVDPTAFMAGLLSKLDSALETQKKVEHYRGYAGLCHHVFDPPTKSGVRMRGSPVGLITETSLERELAPMFPELLMDLFDKFKDDEWDAFWTEDMIERFGGSAVKFDSHEARRDRANETLKSMGLPPLKGVPDVDTFVSQQIELDTRPCPKPDRTFASDNGWCLPNGKFYPCQGPMEHIWLAEKIAGITEKTAESKGWIKVSLSPMFGDQHILSFKKPTQSQINTLFDWSRAAIAMDKTQREKCYDEWLAREQCE